MKSSARPRAKPTPPLAIEDSDSKFAALAAVYADVFGDSELVRAKTVTEGEDYLNQSKWPLLILDVSMDIRGSSKGTMRGGHANLGGLDIVEGMYLTQTTCPTIILTGFDYFQAAAQSGRGELIGLNELEQKARHFLKGHFVACIRYGATGWKEKFRAALLQWSGK